MEKLELLYEGKAKKVYKTEIDDKVIVEFKDDATAFDGEKKGQIKDKGAVNTEITATLFKHLEANGVETHLEEQLSAIDLLVKKVEIIPLEVVVRNIAAGSLAKRLGLEEGTELAHPIVEFYYKDDDLGDPLLTEAHIEVENIATEEEVAKLKELGLKVNQILSDYLAQREVRLIDFKLEFGQDEQGKIYLADEISPDTSRLWDLKTDKKLDKDRFRRDLGDVEAAYQEILKRLT